MVRSWSSRWPVNHGGRSATSDSVNVGIIEIFKLKVALCRHLRSFVLRGNFSLSYAELLLGCYDSYGYQEHRIIKCVVLRPTKATRH